WQIDSLTAPALFRPAAAVRFRPAGFTGSPMPKDEPMASNPPSGAYIDYELASAATQPVVLEIFDANNALVRRYSSADAAPKPVPAKLRTAQEWFAIPSTLSASAGSHRFVWPIRYPAANARTPYSDGVWAPPGNYKVSLTIDGKQFTQPLTIAPDPRVNLPAGAYAEQFALAREIDQIHAAVSAALDEAEKLVADPKTSEADRKRAIEISEVNSP